MFFVNNSIYDLNCESFTYKLPTTWEVTHTKSRQKNQKQSALQDTLSVILIVGTVYSMQFLMVADSEY